MRTRHDVWRLTRDDGDWPEVLEAYRSAVRAMRDLDPPPGGSPTEPRSWQFQAALHGRNRADGRPDTRHGWSACQHGSWFFLAWHRMYLAAFELLIQGFLDDDDWSLPYWYAIDPDDPAGAALPPAFRDPAADNELFTAERSAEMNAGRPLDGLDFLAPAVLSALGDDVYATDDGTNSFGGGRRDRPAYSGGEQGSLEDAPHGSVHVLVGGVITAADGTPLRRGWMGQFDTAALDPVFWLHHANIDRLWQVWLDIDPDRTNPVGESAWRDTRFTFPAFAGGDVSWSIGDVVDTRALGYVYESSAAPSAIASVARRGPLERIEVASGPPRDGRPEVVGGVVDVPLFDDTATTIEMARPATRGLESLDERRVLLRLEGITGMVCAPLYTVYLNIPAGTPAADFPERLAGTIATFGVAEASVPSRAQDGTGVTKVLDITAVRDRLLADGLWDPDTVTVRFEPVGPTGPAVLGDGPADTATTPDIRAARVVVVLA
ncbi:hypothetical protein GIY30_20875 [Gordonia sp. HNM0687]|uniref:Tyrosinase copper-binding domain-containing protein n=1 Tax=Gordonia mangrovi TaxID=2665643 RepID=A0A6L7GYJ8_9ACTN|nr:tyrosinase family protein [Gordonia mangrovi]MXP23795.1 hypothetical protein [Gordonia mangrovi]UVF79846.1 tyrosinase family protein [Gordonia mangrovi]